MAGKYIYGTVVWTDGGSPVEDVRIERAGGTEVETKVSRREAIGFGINNPEFRNRVHAFAMTEAGRIKAWSSDHTEAWHLLSSMFPWGSSVDVDYSRDGQREFVRVLCPTSDGILDYSGQVALLVNRKRTERGIVLKQGGNGATNVVQMLGDVLHGGALTLRARVIR